MSGMASVSDLRGKIFVLTIKNIYIHPPSDVAEGDPPGGVRVLVSGAGLGEAPPGGLQSPPVRDLQQRLQTLNLEIQRGFFLLYKLISTQGYYWDLQTNFLELELIDKNIPYGQLSSCHHVVLSSPCHPDYHPVIIIFSDFSYMLLMDG